MNSAARVAPRAYVSREPIVGDAQQVLGYRLHVSGVGDDASVLGRHVSAEDLDTLTHGHPAFVCVGAESFTCGIPDVVSPGRAVLELAAGTESSDAVRDACVQWRERGFRLAIDGFTCDEPSAGLASFVDYLKVPPPIVTSPDLRARTVDSFGSGSATLIATGINTVKHWDDAAAEGFRRFQGFCIGRPKPGARSVSSRQLASLQLLSALNRPNLSIGELEDVVKHDAGLCYQLLRTINSAAHGLPRTVTSIREALLLLGRDMVRRWASMWAVASINAHAHNEVVVMATVRARVCELLAGSTGDDDLAGETFLAGMCSLLDVMLGQPLEKVLADLPLAPQVRGALAGQENLVGYILDTAVAYERGRFDVCETLAASAHVNPRIIPGAFLEALRWSRELAPPAVQ